MITLLCLRNLGNRKQLAAPIRHRRVSTNSPEQRDLFRQSCLECNPIRQFQFQSRRLDSHQSRALSHKVKGVSGRLKVRGFGFHLTAYPLLLCKQERSDSNTVHRFGRPSPLPGEHSCMIDIKTTANGKGSRVEVASGLSFRSMYGFSKVGSANSRVRL